VQSDDTAPQVHLTGAALVATIGFHYIAPCSSSSTTGSRSAATHQMSVNIAHPNTT
jgi:hypothetical protein